MYSCLIEFNDLFHFVKLLKLFFGWKCTVAAAATFPSYTTNDHFYSIFTRVNSLFLCGFLLCSTAWLILYFLCTGMAPLWRALMWVMSPVCPPLETELVSSTKCTNLQYKTWNVSMHFLHTYFQLDFCSSEQTSCSDYWNLVIIHIASSSAPSPLRRGLVHTVCACV